ncbi:MAG TPA: CHRD domain-containing protein [Gemmatimonadales bacterium]|nr:CHRD domain-containing protein [Gemmatimonadales bacterium]
MNGFRILKVTIVALLLAVSACGDDDEPAGAATNFTATLSGTNEVPPVPSSATGSAVLALSGDQLTYTVNVTNLQNPILAHIHIAPVGENGDVRLNLCGTGAPQPPCTSGSGTIVLAAGTNGTTVGSPAITFDSLVSAMRSGNAYVNVHTDNGQPPPNTGPGDMIAGEIRGQVVSN